MGSAMDGHSERSTDEGRFFSPHFTSRWGFYTMQGYYIVCLRTILGQTSAEAHIYIDPIKACNLNTVKLTTLFIKAFQSSLISLLLMAKIC